MASPPPPPPPPVGEDKWIDYIEQNRRTAASLEQRIHVVELYRSAVNAEPGSIRIWIAYCDYFWSLYLECAQRSGAVASWPLEEQAAAAEFFTLDSALHLWSEGHEATKYRISDSHELWNRWITLERELLDRTRTLEGVRRITHLYRNRLTIPHVAWDDTSSSFSSFLSEYNPGAYEETMRAVTEQSRVAKYIVQQRDSMEMALLSADRAGDSSLLSDTMARYLRWEASHALAARNNDKPEALRVALGLFARALTGIFRTNEDAWIDWIVFISQMRNGLGEGPTRDEQLEEILPNNLDALQRAVQHCPWSGTLWARYIIGGEQSGLSFSDMERIKHAATNSPLEHKGMTGVVDVYATWCGYLRRCAMDPNASDEAVDLADSGLVAALEAVQVWGERCFGSAFQGDPNFRIERIMIYHLTEKHGAIDEARERWEKLAAKDIIAYNYSFWLSYYTWEMNLLQFQKGTGRSPTPAPAPRLSRTPSRPARILQRALQQHLNWTEPILEVYVKHCNDFESSDVLRGALDEVHSLHRAFDAAKNERAAAETEVVQAEAASRSYAQGSQALAAAAAAAAGSQTGVQILGGENSNDLLMGNKRKWESTGVEEDGDSAKKTRAEASKIADVEPGLHSKQEAPKRDRENTSVFVANLPCDVTITKLRQYFRDYGHVNNIQLKTEEDGKSTTALIEFRSVDDAQTALIRDGKYFGEHTIAVTEAAGITLFVTNFPPSADEEYIRGLFGKNGNIFGIRWPSLKYNAHRRFCYVSFQDADSASRATKLHGKLLEGKYRLSIQHSNPTAKKAREGATDEGREVHIKNIPQDMDEKALEQLVSKYGTVKRVRLLHNMAGRNRGSAFVDLETKAEAERVVAELDKVKLESQILKVEISVPAKFKPTARETSVPYKAPSGDNESSAGAVENEPPIDVDNKPNLRSFALLGIPDTVNITRVRALLEPHGHVTKLKLCPDHGGAIVEYSDMATAGKAQLALDGTHFEGQSLRVGTVSQLFKERSNVRVDRVDIPKARPIPSNSSASNGASIYKNGQASSKHVLLPARVRRPVLGSKGAKHGLGFSAISAATTAKTGRTAASAQTMNGTQATKKSNADFRALLLGTHAAGDAIPKDDGGNAKADDHDTHMEVDAVANGK